MKFVKVPGKINKHQVVLYALSTCAWCKLTKSYLKDEGIEYTYVDVDLSDEEDRDKIRQDIQRRGGSLNFPTIIIDEETLITGFQKKEIEKVLKN